MNHQNFKKIEEDLLELENLLKNAKSCESYLAIIHYSKHSNKKIEASERQTMISLWGLVRDLLNMARALEQELNKYLNYE